MATTKKKQQEATTPQVEARIDRLMDGDFKTKAFASATIGGAFAVHGIRVLQLCNDLAADILACT